jgi:hypothetical protein
MAVTIVVKSKTGPIRFPDGDGWIWSDKTVLVTKLDPKGNTDRQTLSAFATDDVLRIHFGEADFEGK